MQIRNHTSPTALSSQMEMVPSIPKPDVSRLLSATAAHPRDLLPWLPRPRPHRRPETSTHSEPLTNAAVLRSITREASTPKQLLSLYTTAARQPGFRHDYPTYKALVTALARLHRFKLVSLILSRMRLHDNLPVGPGLLLPLLDVYSGSGSPRHALDLLLSTAPVHEKVFCKLLSLLIDANQLEHARRMFGNDVVVKLGFGLKVRHYIGVLRVYCDGGDVAVAVEILDEMADRGLVMNVFGYGSLIGRVCRGGRVDWGFELVEQMRRRGKEPDLVIWNSLVHGCVRSGEMERVEGVLKEMEENGVGGNVWTWNTLIGGICEHRGVEEGVKVFSEMRRRGVVPDVVTFTTLVGWLCRERKVVESCVVLGKMVRIEIVPDAACWRILVNGFCGKLVQGVMNVELEALCSQTKIPGANSM